MDRVGLILLAAGASTRMGTPKQLLYYKGRSLLRYAAEVALNSSCQPIVVVLGAYAEQIESQLNRLAVQVVQAQWQEGMSASIRAGLMTLRQTCPELEALVITLGDQPLITSQVIDNLVATYRNTGQPIVASYYHTTVGVPALFHRSLFSELASLEGSAGAKQIIQKHASLVQTVPVPEGSFDLDTPADYQHLLELDSTSTLP